jgi:hypothetical protein
MASSAAQLLKHLNPAVRPSFAGSSAAQSRPPVEGQSFEQLLASARTGAMRTGKQIEIGCDVNPPLEAGQLERMAQAADQVEASGAHCALMMIDGRSFVLDVASRTIQAEMRPDGSGGSAIHRVDAAVAVGGLQDSAAANVLKPLLGLSR